jgi:UDP:flavonoid glycosyltransferase YjiC (YdhE family)
VLSGGSFTLMTEAVQLGRPMLSVPVKKQFEQILNGRYLQKLGFGLTAEEVTARVLGELLERVPEFERNLAAAPRPGHEETLASLEAVLERAVAEGAPPEDGQR